MKRRSFDSILSLGGVVLTVVLIVAGALLMWGYTFANGQVRNQLVEQQITFPSAAAFAQAKPGTEITPGMLPYLQKYAGQQLNTGAQAEAYADHFIAVHLSEMPLGGVYSKVSAASLADPTNAKLAAEVQTVFRGTTLRGPPAGGLRLLQVRADRPRCLHLLIRPGRDHGPAVGVRVHPPPPNRGQCRSPDQHPPAPRVGGQLENTPACSMLDARCSMLSPPWIVTEHDLAGALCAGMGPDEPAEPLATRAPVWATPTTTVHGAVEAMVHHGVRHLVVLGTDGRLAGILSLPRAVSALLGADG